MSFRAHDSDAALIRQNGCIDAPLREHLPSVTIEFAGSFFIRYVTCLTAARALRAASRVSRILHGFVDPKLCLHGWKL